MSRPVAYTYGLGVLLAVISPVFGARDSYPLSTYPMFSSKREELISYFADGAFEGEERRRLPPELVANDEVMQAAVTLRRAITGGRAAMARLCTRIAGRALALPEASRPYRIELGKARFDPIRYLSGDTAPLERSVLHRCRVRS